MSDPEQPEYKEFFKQHPVSKYLVEYLMRATIGALSLFSEEYRWYRDHSKFTGMVAGGMIGTALYHPLEDSDLVAYDQAGAGRFVGYDFNRPAEFPRAHKKGELDLHPDGRLMVFRLDEIVGRPAEHRTPTRHLHLLKIDHIMSLDKATPEELVEEEMLVPTTHEEAFRAAGLYERYAEDLERRTMPDEQTYMVTPKGNTLVVLLGDGGHANPQHDPEPTFAHELGGIRIT